MEWNPNLFYDEPSLGNYQLEVKPELDYVAPVKFKSDDEINQSTDRRLGRNERNRNMQKAAAGVDAAMSVLGLLSAHGVAKRAKQSVDATYKRNIRSIDLSGEAASQNIDINTASTRKNIFSTMNKARTNINANLLNDPRALSTANMSEIQGATGRISQSSDIALSTSKMSAAEAKAESDRQTSVAKSNQEIEKWRQKEAIEGQKAAALRKGVMDVAKTGMMFI